MNGRLLVAWQEAYQQDKGCDDGQGDGTDQNQPANIGNALSASRMRYRDQRGQRREHRHQQPIRPKTKYLGQGEMKRYNGCQRQNNRPARLDMTRSMGHASDNTACAPFGRSDSGPALPVQADPPILEPL